MRTVVLHRYLVTAPGRKRPYLTSFPMTAEDAERQYPGAKADPTTRIDRQVPETEEEHRRSIATYQSAGRDSVQPPR